MTGNIGNFLVSKIGGPPLRETIEQVAERSLQDVGGLICPECGSDLKEEVCPSCDWSVSYVNGIPQFFSWENVRHTRKPLRGKSAMAR